MYRAILFVISCMFCAESFASQTIVFDFESIDLGGDGNFPTSGPAILTDQGLTMTITHENDLGFAFNRRSGVLFTSSFGFQAFSAFGDSTGQTRFDSGAFILDFDSAIDSISVDMGDFGVEQDDLLIQGFSGQGASGTMIAQDTGVIPAANGFLFDTVQISGAGMRSVRIIGGSPDIPNSVFYDNITVNVTAVPEPGVLSSLMALTGVIATMRRRRRRAVVKA